MNIAVIGHLLGNSRCFLLCVANIMLNCELKNGKWKLVKYNLRIDLRFKNWLK